MTWLWILALPAIAAAYWWSRATIRILKREARPDVEPSEFSVNWWERPE